MAVNEKEVPSGHFHDQDDRMIEMTSREKRI